MFLCVYIAHGVRRVQSVVAYTGSLVLPGVAGTDSKLRDRVHGRLRSSANVGSRPREHLDEDVSAGRGQVLQQRRLDQRDRELHEVTTLGRLDCEDLELDEGLEKSESLAATRCPVPGALEVAQWHLCVFYVFSMCFYVFLCVSICFYVFLFVSICLYVFLCVPMCFCVFLIVPICSYVFLCVSMCF